MSKPVLRYYLNEEAKRAGIRFVPPRDSDGGFDLPSLEDVVIPKGGFAALRTGVHFSIPEGYVGIVRDRSSVGLRGGATTAGVIDSSYRGEVKVLMHNFGAEELRFKTGERIAQCILIQYLPGSQSVEAASLEALGETERGSGGFGSTGK